MNWGEIRLQIVQFASPGTTLDQVDTWINAAYRDILQARDWTGLNVEGILQTVAPYSTGTVALTNGSLTVTGTGTTWTAAMDKRTFRVDGRTELYTFYYANATSGELDRPYEGETAAAATYGIQQNIYVLPDDVQFISTITNPYTGHPLRKLTFMQLQEVQAGQTAPGAPQYWAPATDTPEAEPPVRHQVELYPAPDAAIGLPYAGIAAVQEFNENLTSGAPLPWVSPDAIIAGAKALALTDAKDYNGAAVFSARSQHLVEQMHANEARRTGPGRIRMAERYTTHRVRRWTI
jgi:hypothetical protein